MLRTVLAITGKPGLYKLLTQGKGSLIVESYADGRRFPVLMRNQVVSLGDISMYTESGDTPLGEILDKVYAHYEGKPIAVKEMDGEALRNSFAEIVVDFDRDRVHNSDIKKLYNWYNILIGAGFDKFTTSPSEEEPEEDVEKEDKEEKGEN